MGRSAYQARIRCTCLVILCALAQAKAQSDAGYTYHAEVAEVRLSFAASDENGRPVESLTSADLAVVDNGAVIRQFRSFAHSPERELNVVVLVDSSASVAAKFQQEVRSVLELIASARWGPSDSVSVLFFGGREPRFVCAHNCRSTLPEDRLTAVKADGLTPLFDALVLGAATVGGDHATAAKAVLIVFSDGSDTISRSSVAEAMSAIQKADATVYTVDMNNPRFGASPVLQLIAGGSGGLSFPFGKGAQTALTAILEDLRRAYVVTYLPSDNAEGTHAIRILPTRNLNLRFRCRQSYQVGKNSAGSWGLQ